METQQTEAELRQELAPLDEGQLRHRECILNGADVEYLSHIVSAIRQKRIDNIIRLSREQGKISD